MNLIKRIFSIGLVVCFSVILQNDLGIAEEKEYEGSVSIGGIFVMDDIDSDEDGAKGTEYNSVLDNTGYWDLKGELGFEKDGLAFKGEAHYQYVDEQEYGAILDLKRILRLKTDYSRFLHRLDHDELENLNAHIFSNTDPGPSAGKGYFVDFNGDGTNNKNEEIVGSAAVYHTDLGAGDEYHIMRSEWNNNAVLHIPQIPGLKLSFSHRFEERKGLDQARTMSKCSACHIVADSKSIDEETNDYMPKVSLNTENFAIEYSFLHRDFDDKSEDMSVVYNNLATTHLGFTNRLQFDGRDGPLPYSKTPDSQKDAHTLKAKWNVNRTNTVTAALVYSQSTNKSTDGPYDILTGNLNDELEMDSTAIMARWHNRVSRKLSFNVFGKYQTIDNDDAFIDVVDRTNADGTTLGDGYSRSALGAAEGLQTGFWDFTRKSGYDLDITTLGFDVAWRPMHGVTLRGAYEFHYEDRENAEEHNVPDDTTEHTIKLSGDWRVMHSLKLGFGYKLELVDDPYALKFAVCAPDGSYGEYGGPPGSLYDYSRSYDPTIYSKRVGTRSNLPETAHEFSFKANWMPITVLSTNVYAKYKMAENDDVDGNSWEQDLFSGGINVVLTPNEKISFVAGYDYFNDKYESMYCIAIYDG
ncbi:decaheme-associated outer membrane protein, MtrB/PioB family [Dissulfuribacter thermophilus]|nr:decaheme-associated outer membrane protein, MtrB/PioB family [Dissulfuribacter thermophilus]